MSSSDRRAAGALATPLAALLLAAPAAGLDTLAVGQGARSWIDAQESSTFLRVALDSIWTPSAARGENLVLGARKRGGEVYAEVLALSVTGAVPVWVVDIEPLEAAAAIADGDGNTAFSPIGLRRAAAPGGVYVDLGASFEVDRIRFHPRLDDEHAQLLLSAFALSVNDGNEPGYPLDLPYDPVAGFSGSRLNQLPVVEVRFRVPRPVRYVHLAALQSTPWEVAELEVYATAAVPTGQYVSAPILVKGAEPVWGEVKHEGGSTADLPLRIQTRTGPDEDPDLYYAVVVASDSLVRVSRQDWLNIGASRALGLPSSRDQGPVEANPEWSPWETVTDGTVRSPGARRFFQFRLFLPVGGTTLRRLLFEHARLPLAEEVAAEIAPLVVDAGQTTGFTLSLEAHLSRQRGHSGIRYLRVLTTAEVEAVDRVLVDDEPAVYTAAMRPGEGFVLDLWRRMLREGTYLQVQFRGRVFRDGTTFEVQALDRRPAAGVVEEVYQVAREGDVDPISLGGQLEVRLRSGSGELLGALQPATRAITPNGDGLNDRLELAFDLLKLTRPGAVAFAIFDLAGNPVRRGAVEQEGIGRRLRVWDGRDDGGRLVPPGLYLYQVRLDTDAGPAQRTGPVGVAY